MSKNEQTTTSFVVSLALFMTLIITGCVSVQMPSASGRPKLIGWGDAHTNNCREGQILDIATSGLSLRCDANDPGISFGWYRMRLFYPATDKGKPSRSIAVETRCLGISLAPTSMMFGYDKKFAIPLPCNGAPLVQTIEYSEDNPTNTVIERKEIQ
jgi:hypothetical protein